MIRLVNTEINDPSYRHRTWTKIGENRRQVSSLQNQFALAEYGLSADEAVQRYRRWLWRELQDPLNVVARELRLLAEADRAGLDVEILVPKDAPHGDVLIRALQWLNAEVTEGRNAPELRGSAPGPCHEPIFPDGVLAARAEIDPKHIVWVTGRTQSRIGVICAYGQAFVPGYGVIALRNFRWVDRRLAHSAALQQYLNDALDEAFEVEARATPVEYSAEPNWLPEDRFDHQAGWFWEQTDSEAQEAQAAIAEAERDTLTLAEQLAEETEDWETALAVAQMPEIEGWYRTRPPLPSHIMAETIRPAYRYCAADAPLMVQSVEDQIDGHAWHYASQAEAEAFRRTFHPTSCEGNFGQSS